MSERGGWCSMKKFSGDPPALLHPGSGAPERLTGLLSDRRSLRVGDWRILYKIRRSELLILVMTVGHRREVYDD